MAVFTQSDLVRFLITWVVTALFIHFAAKIVLDRSSFISALLVALVGTILAALVYVLVSNATLAIVLAIATWALVCVVLSDGLDQGGRRRPRRVGVVLPRDAARQRHPRLRHVEGRRFARDAMPFGSCRCGDYVCAGGVLWHGEKWTDQIVKRIAAKRVLGGAPPRPSFPGHRRCRVLGPTRLNRR